MKRYLVSGMVCAACRARVEKAVGRVPGVTSCAVNLLTGSLNVGGSFDPDAVIRAVRQAGYEAVPAPETTVCIHVSASSPTAPLCAERPLVAVTSNIGVHAASPPVVNVKSPAPAASASVNARFAMVAVT